MYSSKPVGEWRSTLASLDMPRYEVSPTDYHGDDDDYHGYDGDYAGDACDHAGDDDSDAANHKTLTHIMIILSL